MTGGKLTIDDTSAEKTGQVLGDAFAVVVKDGLLTVNNGSFGYASEESGWWEPLLVGGGSAVINDGFFFGGTLEYFYCYTGAAEGSLLVNGGRFDALPLYIAANQGAPIWAPNADGYVVAYKTYGDFAADNDSFVYDSASNVLKMTKEYTKSASLTNPLSGFFINGDVILDLNGQTWTMENANMIVVNEGTTLTVRDSAGNGVIENKTEAVIETLGTLNIESGTLSTANTSRNVIAANGNCTINITGGKLEGKQYGIISKRVTAGREDRTINISGGEFSTDRGFFNKAWGENGAATVAVSGGTFKVKPVEQYIATGLEAKDNGDGTFSIVIPDGKVAQIVGGGAYETLAEAITNCPAGGTVTLLKDITIDATTDINQNSAVFIINKAITLDGNGKSITAGTNFGNTNIINVENSGNVTIKNLTIKGAGNSRHGINIFSSTGTTSKSVVTLENVVTTGGLTGVTIVGSDVTIKGDQTNIATGSWNVAVNLDSTNSGANAASLAVEGGTIGNIYIENTAGTPKVTATVTDGSISSLTIKKTASASAEISGGTFDNQPADLTVKEGYIAAKNETTGKFFIRERNPSTLTTNIDQVKFVVGVPTEFTFTTTANDDAGTNVIGTSNFSNSEAIEKLEYYEVKDGQWYELKGDFGPSTGFPMSNATSKFRVTFKTAGTYSFTASMKTADGGKELCNTEVKFTVSEPAPVVPTYSITAPKADNGTVTVSPKYASKGTNVTITVTPDEGYELDTLTVTDAKGNELELTDLGDGKYSFKMPSSKVTVNATFVETDPEPVTDPVKDCPKDETCPAAKFEDVKLGEWYHDGVHYCIVEGLMNGTGATTFEPDSTTERAMLVTVLYRLEGKPEVGENTFTDVRANEWYTDAITWAAENKIVEGYGDGLFGPEDSITREQFATILYRYAKYKGYDVTAKADITSFVDGANTEDWAEDAMSWAVAEKLINGIENNQLDPQGDATRAQMATILYRFCENVAK